MSASCALRSDNTEAFSNPTRLIRTSYVERAFRVDANVLFAAAWRPRSALQRLWALHDVELLSLSLQFLALGGPNSARAKEVMNFAN
jgi:hypothetical protein